MDLLDGATVSTSTELWDGKADPAKREVPGIFKITGSGKYSFDFSENLSCSITFQGLVSVENAALYFFCLLSS